MPNLFVGARTAMLGVAWKINLTPFSYVVRFYMVWRTPDIIMVDREQKVHKTPHNEQ